MIVGGGFAGVACAKRLAKHDGAVTLIDRHNYNQFQPLLYQIASAQVNTTDVARPLRAIFRKHKSVTVKVADVVAVDPAAKTVTSADGVTFSGDYLVLAMGGEANFFGTPGAEEHAFPSTRSTTPSASGRACSRCSKLRTGTRSWSTRVR